MAEVGRRLKGLPRGAWGMTLAHGALGLFVLGACFESTFKLNTAQSLSLGGAERLGAYVLKLDRVGALQGPNFDAERALVEVDRNGREICLAAPERRLYEPGGQTTSDVAICQQGLDDIYVVLGDRRPDANGARAWVVRGFFNPWARLIFFGPILMGLGGLISLSDRRLRFAAGRRAVPVASPALGPAE
jgi:cytochrome c-type biogenesis protein CcmF